MNRCCRTLQRVWYCGGVMAMPARTRAAVPHSCRNLPKGARKNKGAQQGDETREHMTSATPSFLTPQNTRSVAVRTCYHTPFYHPSFITPPNTPCGCSDALSHPLVCHPPLRPPCELHFITRVHKIPHTPHVPHPVIIFPKPKMLSPGCIILCHIR